MKVYFDESGDLGWKFEKPYMHQGSSRFLTLAFLLCSNDEKKYPERLVKKFKKRYGLTRADELKGSRLKPSQREDFARRVFKLLETHPTIWIRCITVRKENVKKHIQRDQNKLYNYMIKLCLLPAIRQLEEVELIPDPRAIKIASGNSMIDYLQTTLYFEMDSITYLAQNPISSDRCYNLQFIDGIAHIVWRYHELCDQSACEIIQSKIKCQHLFFGNTAG